LSFWTGTLSQIGCFYKFWFVLNVHAAGNFDMIFDEIIAFCFLYATEVDAMLFAVYPPNVSNHVLSRTKTTLSYLLRRNLLYPQFFYIQCIGRCLVELLVRN